MALIPSASTSLDPTAGSSGAGTGYLVLLFACALSADVTPRVFASSTAMYQQHGYCEAVEYMAIHADEAKTPVIGVGLPIVTAGTIGQLDQSGVTGTCDVTVAAGANGILAESDVEIEVDVGGTVGTDSIKLLVSLDGGRTQKPARLGTALTYTVPFHGHVLTFKTGTTLIAGDVITYKTKAPRWDQAGVASARTALAAQLKLSRSWLLIGDLVDEDDATDVVTEANSYETANQRFVYARAQVRDAYVAAKKSKTRVHMTGAPSVTFAEVGATGDTITRATGSFVTDGFTTGMVVTVVSALNPFANAVITNVTATVLTLDTQDLVAETTSAVTITGSEKLTFAEVGVTGDTITRTIGSWVADGFKAGDAITITGTASNNLVSAVVTDVTATVLTLDTGDLVAEVIGSFGVSITAPAESLTEHVAAADAEWTDIDAEPRIDLGIGRARKLSPFTGYRYRRPVAWAASIREYQHDVHVPIFAKAFGPLKGWDLEDENGNLVEYDERVTGGALAGRFTCFRTWSNGPSGAFIALDLTRDEDDTVLSRTQNIAVTNLAMSTVQRAAENAIGVILQRNADDTGTPASLQLLEETVNTDLAIALLQPGKEGPRAQSARWEASRTDVLAGAGATLSGVLALKVGAVLEHINTVVRVS